MPVLFIGHGSPMNAIAENSFTKALNQLPSKVPTPKAIVKHIYPTAEIPVIQLSLSIDEPPEYHFKLGEQLKFLREKGVLIVGSGNIVHNLRRMNVDENAKAYDWALEADDWMKKKIEERDFNSLVHDAIKTEAGKLSIPTWEHYFPLLYILGASDRNDELTFVHEGFQNASISMRALMFR